jgi:hypothetical protein
LPLIYLQGIRIFPALLNGDYAKHIGGDVIQLQRMGFWNDVLAARWQQEADVLLVAGDRTAGAASAGTSLEVGVTPPVYACLPESKIRVLRNP